MTREDNRRIAFVLGALGCEAIRTEELKRWCEELLRRHDLSDLPDYVLELLEFDEDHAKVFKVLGFVPDELKTQERNALFGIAAKRGVDPMDWPIKREAALRALEASPKVEGWFRTEFPFVSF